MNHVGGLCASLKRNSLTLRDRKKLSSALSERVFTVNLAGAVVPALSEELTLAHTDSLRESG